MDAIPRVELPLLHLFPHLLSLISYTYGLSLSLSLSISLYLYFHTLLPLSLSPFPSFSHFLHLFFLSFILDIHFYRVHMGLPLTISSYRDSLEALPESFSVLSQYAALPSSPLMAVNISLSHTRTHRHSHTHAHTHRHEF